MKGKKLLIATLLASATAFGFAGCGGKDTEKPVITVTGVPTSCEVQDEVTLPAATAMDNKDGDISSKVKVTVTRMKADGTTPDREIINKKQGNVIQKFTAASNTLLKYTILYEVTDNAGNVATVTYTLTAVGDNETGTLTLNESSVDGFNLQDGIVGVAGQDVQLPSATAIDNPSKGGVDISDRIEARLYAKNSDGSLGTSVFTKWADFREVKTVRIPAGEYVLKYSVEDKAGNKFETTYEVPVTISAPAAQNLVSNLENLTFDNDETVEGKRGMSWVNDYGEFCFGQTMDRPELDQTVGFTANTTKVFDQYVAIAFNADVPTGNNSQDFYTISARGSKNATGIPNKETCTWPNYLFLRLQAGGKIESRVERNADAEMTIEKGYTGASLIDGNYHVLYVQWRSLGDSASAPNASIKIYGWVDKTPAVGYENADFIFSAVAGEANTQGKLERATFERLWNEDTGAGWFSMDTKSKNAPHDNDHMRLKGLVIYDADETEFGVDILPPEITTGFTQQEVYDYREAITVPTASVVGADTVKAYIVDGQGNKTEVTSGSWTASAPGTYTLLYEATDSAGNYAHKEYTLKCMVRDNEAPTLTLTSEATINATVGQAVTLPNATVSDNIDDELDMEVTVDIIGTEHNKGCTPGGKYYPMTAGTQKAIYSVKDSYGNVTTKEITINVTGSTTGDMLGGRPLTSTNAGVGLSDKEWIYDQKVSMILNISQLKNIVMFNVRGPVSISDWPTGMVIRFVNTNDITISASGHDSYIFGRTAYSKQKYIVGNDILFEYQVKNVVIGDVEYIRTQMWVQGEELVFTPDALNGGEVGLETGVNAIYRKVSAFTGAMAENIYSSPFWMSSYNASAEVKELRIDGTSCTKPADPIPPDRFDVTFNNGDKELLTAPTTITGGGDAHVVIGKYSNEEYVAVTFQGEVATKGAFCLNITGNAEGWNGGIVLRVTQDGAAVYVGGPNSTEVAKLNIYPYDGGIKATSYTLVYKLTYVDDGTGKKTGVKLDVWFGEQGSTTLPKCEMSSVNGTYATLEGTTLTLKATAFATAEEMTPGNITVVSLRDLNGDCDWMVRKIEILNKAPNA